jgi:hypothetical protein
LPGCQAARAVGFNRCRAELEQQTPAVKFFHDERFQFLAKLERRQRRVCAVVRNQIVLRPATAERSDLLPSG